MTLLAGTNYDPGTAVTAATSSRLAMTAFDTTNLRLTFTVPTNGAVLVRIRTVMHGATGQAQTFLGVLEGSTVKGRVAPVGAVRANTAATSQVPMEALFVVPGLTPAASLTWDAAYAVDVLFASTGFKYGGPNNTTTNDAFGGFVFEIWETPNLLGAILYDPTGGARVVKACNALLAMTAIDTTNLRITFTAPSSGNVLVRLKCVAVNLTTPGVYLLGVMEGATVKGRQSPIGGLMDTQFVIDRQPNEASFVVTGLTPGTSYTWDAAYGVEIVTASGSGSGIGYGGPDDTTTENAGGAFAYEIWEV